MTFAEKETTLKELEANLWETADSLRNESSLTSQMYYMPVLGIIFLRHATYRFRMVEKALVEDPTWPKRKGVPRPVVPDDFATKSAMFVPEKYAKLLVEYEGAIAEADQVAKDAGDAAELRQQAEAVEAAKAKGWRQEKKTLLLTAAKAEALAKARDEIAAERECDGNLKELGL